MSGRSLRHATPAEVAEDARSMRFTWPRRWDVDAVPTYDQLLAAALQNNGIVLL